MRPHIGRANLKEMLRVSRGARTRAILRAYRREQGGLHHGPSIEAVCGLASAASLRLPEPGEVFLTALIARTHGDDPVRPDPFNDFIGILRRHPVGHAPEPDRLCERTGSHDDGVLEWWSTLGTAEPGWAPMHRQGRIPTHPDGCARFVAPQLAEASHGGGFHFWDEDRPAFRQVRPALIQRYDPDAAAWGEPFAAAIAAHAHSIPPYLDWRAVRERGVGDNSHACLVPLHPHRHALLLQRGGWTREMDGCALSLLALLLPPELYP